MWVSPSSVSSAWLAVTPSVHAHVMVFHLSFFFNFIICPKFSMSDLSRICNQEKYTEQLFSFWLDTL